jgi:hypothetical protein
VKNFLLYKLCLPVWHAVLDITRPIRDMLGLRARRP